MEDVLQDDLMFHLYPGIIYFGTTTCRRALQRIALCEPPYLGASWSLRVTSRVMSLSSFLPGDFFGLGPSSVS